MLRHLSHFKILMAVPSFFHKGGHGDVFLPLTPFCLIGKLERTAICKKISYPAEVSAKELMEFSLDEAAQFRLRMILITLPPS